MTNERRKPDIWRNFTTKKTKKIKEVIQVLFLDKKRKEGDALDPAFAPAILMFEVTIKGFNALYTSRMVWRPGVLYGVKMVELYIDAEMTKWAVRDPKQQSTKSGMPRLFGWNRWGSDYGQKGNSLELSAADRAMLIAALVGKSEVPNA